MIVRFESVFLKYVKAISNDKIKARLLKFIDEAKTVDTLNNLQGIMRLKGHPSAFRYRIGDYRVGLFIQPNEIIFSRCLHRKEIYRFFP